ncbi:hypothetical protein Q2T40_16570 [Winogradskyella maritima]|uniref:PH (Pleckstrin Homology) domain-containing protein n=1 Tax=Winogradskyella maritima TaxID=1517766 RepID=A0ABV8AIZ5_9FLAO|nr:hypothetical protein [Winogradskyella maritima]
MTLKINYKKKQLKQFLYLGLVWLLLGVIQVWLMFDQWWLSLGWLILGLIYVYIYAQRKSNGYMTISNSEIKQNWWFGKRIPTSDIAEIKYFAGDYVVLSENKTIRINKEYLNEESLERLKERLEDLKEKLNI